ncbi:type II toxin-antitoxin system HipA family toxin [Ramlibacter sp. MAHUQ-53]|uniref:type II toxin-antitoxin system HipA family toxin n=1 Tax=unclassified Ramlibacter TaxID=2617605 RepID=UPI003626B354
MAKTEPEAYVPREALHLWWLGDPGQPRPVGEIRLVQGGRGVGLRYAPAWLAAGFALSEDLPLVDQLFLPAERDTAAGSVDDARPDRWGERVIRKFERTPRLSLLEYLLFAGGDRYGALGVSLEPDAWVPWRNQPTPEFEQLGEMAEAVRKVLANEPVPEMQRRLVNPGASLGGARPKSLLRMEGRQWLVKFNEDDEFDMPLVEHACMTLARACGIETAATRALRLPRGHAVAIERFDRIEGARLHTVSAHVALRAAGESLGYPEFAQLLRRFLPAREIARQQAQLFRRMVFNILVDNTDDHEKNHALLRHPDGSYHLAPAFDVLPTAQGLGYQQMRVGEQGSESTLGNALSASAQFGLKPKAAREIVSEVRTGVGQWAAHFRAHGVRRRDIDYLARFVDRDALKA